MGYRDCPCLKCDHGGEREKRIECRRKCTEKAMKQKNWTEKVADRRLEEIGCRI